YAMPEMRERLISLAAEPSISTPGEFTAPVKSELGKWAKAVKGSGAKLEKMNRPMTNATPSAQLAGVVTGRTYQSLPQRAQARVKDILLDTLASAIAGRQGDESKQIRALAAALGASHEATVIGGEPLSLAGATLLNGYLITAVTVCDVHRPT